MPKGTINETSIVLYKHRQPYLFIFRALFLMGVMVTGGRVRMMLFIVDLIQTPKERMKDNKSYSTHTSSSSEANHIPVSTPALNATMFLKKYVTSCIVTEGLRRQNVIL